MLINGVKIDKPFGGLLEVVMVRPTSTAFGLTGYVDGVSRRTSAVQKIHHSTDEVTDTPVMVAETRNTLYTLTMSDDVFDFVSKRHPEFIACTNEENNL